MSVETSPNNQALIQKAREKASALRTEVLLKPEEKNPKEKEGKLVRIAKVASKAAARIGGKADELRRYEASRRVANSSENAKALEIERAVAELEKVEANIAAQTQEIESQERALEELTDQRNLIQEELRQNSEGHILLQEQFKTELASLNHAINALVRKLKNGHTDNAELAYDRATENRNVIETTLEASLELMQANQNSLSEIEDSVADTEGRIDTIRQEMELVETMRQQAADRIKQLLGITEAPAQQTEATAEPQEPSLLEKYKTELTAKLEAIKQVRTQVLIPANRIAQLSQAMETDKLPATVASRPSEMKTQADAIVDKLFDDAAYLESIIEGNTEADEAIIQAALNYSERDAEAIVNSLAAEAENFKRIYDALQELSLVANGNSDSAVTKRAEVLSNLYAKAGQPDNQLRRLLDNADKYVANAKLVVRLEQITLQVEQKAAEAQTKAAQGNPEAQARAQQIQEYTAQFNQLIREYISDGISSENIQQMIRAAETLVLPIAEPQPKTKTPDEIAAEQAQAYREMIELMRPGIAARLLDIGFVQEDIETTLVTTNQEGRDLINGDAGIAAARITLENIRLRLSEILDGQGNPATQEEITSLCTEFDLEQSITAPIAEILRQLAEKNSPKGFYEQNKAAIEAGYTQLTQLMDTLRALPASDSSAIKAELSRVENLHTRAIAIIANVETATGTIAEMTAILEVKDIAERVEIAKGVLTLEKELPELNRYLQVNLPKLNTDPTNTEAKTVVIAVTMVQTLLDEYRATGLVSQADIFDAQMAIYPILARIVQIAERSLGNDMIVRDTLENEKNEWYPLNLEDAKKRLAKELSLNTWVGRKYLDLGLDDTGARQKMDKRIALLKEWVSYFEAIDRSETPTRPQNLKQSKGRAQILAHGHNVVDTSSPLLALLRGQGMKLPGNNENRTLERFDLIRATYQVAPERRSNVILSMDRYNETDGYLRLRVVKPNGVTKFIYILKDDLAKVTESGEVTAYKDIEGRNVEMQIQIANIITTTDKQAAETLGTAIPDLSTQPLPTATPRPAPAPAPAVPPLSPVAGAETARTPETTPGAEQKITLETGQEIIVGGPNPAIILLEGGKKMRIKTEEKTETSRILGRVTKRTIYMAQIEGEPASYELTMQRIKELEIQTPLKLGNTRYMIEQIGEAQEPVEVEVEVEAETAENTPDPENLKLSSGQEIIVGGDNPTVIKLGGGAQITLIGKKEQQRPFWQGGNRTVYTVQLEGTDTTYDIPEAEVKKYKELMVIKLGSNRYEILEIGENKTLIKPEVGGRILLNAGTVAQLEYTIKAVDSGTEIATLETISPLTGNSSTIQININNLSLNGKVTTLGDNPAELTVVKYTSPEPVTPPAEQAAEARISFVELQNLLSSGTEVEITNARVPDRRTVSYEGDQILLSNPRIGTIRANTDNVTVDPGAQGNIIIQTGLFKFVLKKVEAEVSAPAPETQQPQEMTLDEIKTILPGRSKVTLRSGDKVSQAEILFEEGDVVFQNTEPTGSNLRIETKSFNRLADGKLQFNFGPDTYVIETVAPQAPAEKTETTNIQLVAEVMRRIPGWSGRVSRAGTVEELNSILAEIEPINSNGITVLEARLSNLKTAIATKRAAIESQESVEAV